MDGSRSLLRAASTVGSLTLVSRVLGLVRERLNAQVLGDSPAMDAFVLAFRIPNLFRRMFGEGAFASALIPVWAGVRRARSPEAAQRWLGSVFRLLGLALAGAVLLQWAVAAGLAWRGRDLLALLLFLVAPYTLLVCKTAAWGAVLQVEGRFASTAFSPSVLNVLWIGALAACAAAGRGARAAAIASALAVVAAGGIQWGLQVLQGRRVGIRPRGPLSADDPDTRRVGRLMLPMAFGAAVFQVNLLLDSVLADSLGRGAVSHLWYADRVMELPLALLGLSLATAVYPRLGNHFRTGNVAAAGEAMGTGLRTGLLLLLPSAVGIAILAEPILRVLYGTGSFDAGGLDRTRRVLVAYAFGLPGFGLGHLLVRLLQASGRPSVPVRIGAATVAGKLLLSLAWMGSLREEGLAWATAAAAAAQAVLLWRAAAFYRLPWGGGTGLGRATALGIAASAAMGICVWLWSRAAAPWGPWAQLAGGVALGAGLYLLLARRQLAAGRRDAG